MNKKFAREWTRIGANNLIMKLNFAVTSRICLYIRAYSRAKKFLSRARIKYKFISPEKPF